MKGYKRYLRIDKKVTTISNTESKRYIGSFKRSWYLERMYLCWDGFTFRITSFYHRFEFNSSLHSENELNSNL